MSRRARGPAALLTLCLALASITACSSDDGPEQTLQAFLDGWPTGEFGDLGFMTPAGQAVASPAVAEQIAELSGELQELAPGLTIEEVTESSDVATGQVAVAWPLSAAEDPPVWQYRTTVRLSEGDDGWRVIWEPAVVHPELTSGDTLAVRREAATRAEILDGAGDPLVTARHVVDIGIARAQADDLDGDLAIIDDSLRSIGVEIDMADLRDRVDDADPDHFVPVVTLRWDDYQPIRERVRHLGAIAFHERDRHLAPTRTFARALLGTVDDVTAEVMEENPGVFAVGDQVGFGGLSERYDSRLRGVTGQTVVLVRTAPDGDTEETELYAVEPVPGEDLRTTLDVDVQAAAEESLHTDDRRAALVAIRVSDGEVLAVANTHGADANPVNLAFTGAVPPGSTFKMVSAYGLLSTGEVSLDTAVDCPREFAVGGRSFRNDDHFALGEVSFLTNIAASCNTAFAALAPRLADGGLAGAGAELGVGGDWDLGLETFTGEVSQGGDPAELAAAAFGQGTTRVSPAAMAAATAAVARGEWLPPTLLPDEATPADPVALDSSAVADLHTALREVVTDGTATTLRGVPGGDVYGKTGTAEVDDATHGWFVGWQGDLAFAVFVEDGQSGSGSAVPLVDQFLRALA